MTRRNAGEGMVRQRPNGLWEARYVAADGRKRSLYSKTKREVADKLRNALIAADQGVRPVDQRLTMRAYLDSWLTDHVRPSVRSRTLESYTFVAERFLKPHLGHLAAAQLQPEDVQRLMRDLGSRTPPLSPTTVRYCYTVLRIALGRAVKLGRAHRNVAILIDPPGVSRREVQPMSGAEARSFLASVVGERWEPLYRLAIVSGLRQGELLGLRWVDIDLDVGTLPVRHTLQMGTRILAEPKTDRARRTLSLDPPTVELLELTDADSLRSASPPATDGRMETSFSARRSEHRSTIGTLSAATTPRWRRPKSLGACSTSFGTPAPRYS